MKKLMIIALIFMVTSAFSTSWKGGNTAKYDADTVCSTKYYLHRPGTSFPSNTWSECCQIFASSDQWLIIPVSCDSIDTFYIPIPVDSLPSESLIVNCPGGGIIIIDSSEYHFDTLIVTQQNGVYDISDVRWFCDSVLVVIDTMIIDSLGNTIVFNDTTWCKTCDSFLVENRFIVDGSGDTIIMNIYSHINPILTDSCGIFRLNDSTDINLNITYCYSCDTNITVINYPPIIPSWWFYVTYEETGSTERVNRGDIIVIPFGSGGSSGGGIYVKDCSCTTSVTVVTDSFDAVFAIDTTWNVIYTDRTYNEDGTFARIYDDGNWRDRASCSYSDRYGDVYDYAKWTLQYANHTDSTVHKTRISGWGNLSNATGSLTYTWNANDTMINLFGLNDTISYNGGVLTTGKYFYCDTVDSTPAVFTSLNRSCNSSNDEYDTTWSHTQPVLPIVIAQRFEKIVNFTDYYSNTEISNLNSLQPHWVLATMRDDFTPYVEINGVIYDLDTIAVPIYGNMKKKTYEIPLSSTIDYNQDIIVKIGVYSCAAPFIGLSAIFGLKYATTDTIVDTCWTLRDSITLPDCSGSSNADTFYTFRTDSFNADGILLSGDTIYFDTTSSGVDTCSHIMYYGLIMNQYYDSVNTCGGDTLDFNLNNAWIFAELGDTVILSDTLFRTISFVDPDTVKSFDFGLYPDSVKISYTGTLTPIAIKNPLKLEGNALITDNASLFITDQNGTDSLHLYDSGDTTFLDSENPVRIPNFVSTLTHVDSSTYADTAQFSLFPDSADVNGWIKKDTFYMSYGNSIGSSSIIADGDSIYIDTSYVKNLDSLGYYFDSLTINSMFTNYFDSLEINNLLGTKLDTTTFNTTIGAYYDTTVSKTLFVDSTEIKHLSTLLIGDSASFTDFPLAKLIVSEGNTGHSYAFNLGIVGEATGGSVLKAVGVGGVALLGGTKDVFGTFGRAKIGNTSYTGDAIGLKGASEETHAGGRNIGVYSIATGGNLSYSFYGEDGLIFNERSISTNDSISAIGLTIGSGTVIDKMVNIGSHFGFIRGTDTTYALSDTITSGVTDTFQIVRSDSFNTTGWIHNGDAIYVDTTGGTATPSDSVVWNTLVGRRTANQEIKIFGTANLANRLDGSLFKCKRGSSTTVGYIDSCVYASDSITVTVVTTDTLLIADSTIAPMRYTPNFKVDNFLRTISLYGEIIADTLYSQGMWYWMQDACYLLPIDAYLVTAAATTPALTFKFYSDATALNTTAFDMEGNASLLRQRMTTKNIARGTRLSMRIWSVAGTTKPADFQVNMYVIPQKIYLGE